MMQSKEEIVLQVDRTLDSMMKIIAMQNDVIIDKETLYYGDEEDIREARNLLVRGIANIIERNK